MREWRVKWQNLQQKIYSFIIWSHMLNWFIFYCEVVQFLNWSFYWRPTWCHLWRNLGDNNAILDNFLFASDVVFSVFKATEVYRRLHYQVCLPVLCQYSYHDMHHCSANNQVQAWCQVSVTHVHVHACDVPDSCSTRCATHVQWHKGMTLTCEVIT